MKLSQAETTRGRGPGRGPGSEQPELEALDEAECLRLIAPGGVGRIAFSGRYGPTVLPVNYRLFEGTIVFRIARDSPTDEDLRTGIANAEYQVAFEIDDFDAAARAGWSVLVQGPAHHVNSEAERASVSDAGVRPWPGGDRELFLRVIPARITGRRIHRS
jgi:nitroimidazol reductase NimA-like FMN-containing flavoprotein (pyridoxamine 5'-phosphate oxidase superfamily)